MIERFIRIRKHDVVINGVNKITVIIRDVNDSIQFEKMLLQQEEDSATVTIIQKEIDPVFFEHCTMVEKLLNENPNEKSQGLR